jgi:hypothetical protein
MHYFNSTAISAATYDSASGTLTLWFAGGRGGYDYHNVPKAVFDGLLCAVSKGHYFNAYIRDQYAA